MVKYVIECYDEGRHESKFDDLLNGTIFSIACGSAAVDIRKNVPLPYYTLVKRKFRLRVITQQEKLLAFLDFNIPQYSDQAPDKNRVYEIMESWVDVFQIILITLILPNQKKEAKLCKACFSISCRIRPLKV